MERVETAGAMQAWCHSQHIQKRALVSSTIQKIPHLSRTDLWTGSWRSSDKMPLILADSNPRRQRSILGNAVQIRPLDECLIVLSVWAFAEAREWSDARSVVRKTQYRHVSVAEDLCSQQTPV